MFERFWRKDAARTGGRHSGLGLSIVQALADALGIQVTADLTADRVFTVSLRFPAQGAV
jgi:two-component system sensor histidine kinase QseC